MNDRKLTLTSVLVCGGLLVTLSMGIRHGFGLFNLPITQTHGWNRETFAFALALQNLMWGASQPITGALADKFGAMRIMLIGVALYVAGLIVMALATSGTAFATGAGVLIGIAQSGTTYSVVYGVIGRVASPDKRVWAMGIAAAAGSFGQFLMIPVEQTLISTAGWQNALYILAFLACFMLPLALMLREPKIEANTSGPHQSIGEATREAFSNRNFQLLTLGYFVCGFQVVFIGVHLTPYLKDRGFADVKIATVALALIGLFNVFGTYTAGAMGQRMPKRYLLSAIYLARSFVIAGYLMLPLSAWSTWIFAALMGFLWLSTVPLTNGIIAQVFGVKYLSMLSGVVFFSHQIGSFLGAWLGGYLFDKTGSYDMVWMIAIGLGVLAALVNLPIREHALVRTQPAGA
ncbi:MAG: MFS transporter [Cupriavidus sp.]|uniref:MFS transporter n=1 Tax=Cupriavidus pauculus TaxID=82633 RepID=UPI000C584D38|nr:MFS transporter [Cupriavidus pauculus]KAB0599816.1 MFS transporter [Cupriavidus pauculus]MBU64026.1 MFS transporter [Cupriavidus sp.]MCM3608823.1 MFS transporter [Cupriavidus pauculus]UAL00202.1 MFS transporter [Cupriavidus pauculus]